MEKLAVGIPAYGDFKAQTVASLVPAISAAPVPVFFDMVRMTYLPQARQMLADRAVAAGASHLLMVDTDMVFPANVVELLARHDKDIVAANAHEKTFGPNGERIGMTKFGEYPNYEPRVVDTSKPFECSAVGTAVILIDLRSLERVPRPWFDTSVAADGSVTKLLGEDIYFCAKAREHGLEVWCDPTFDVHHVGEFLY